MRSKFRVNRAKNIKQPRLNEVFGQIFQQVEISSGTRLIKYKVKTLGLWLSTDPDTALRLNYNEKTENIRKLLSCWNYLRLTLLGKIAVLKSLAALQQVYLLSPFPSNHHTIKE